MTRKEALDVLRKNIPTDKSLPVYEALQTLIPELRESEDERILRVISEAVITFFSDYANDFEDEDRDAALAWLEKQKEQKSKAKAKSPLSPHELYDAKIEGISQGRQDVLDHPEQFGLQKPAEWSEEALNVMNLVYRCIRKVLAEFAVYTENEELLESREETVCYYSQRCAEKILKSLRPQPSWKPSEDELAKKHLDGYCMGREDTMREMKDFIESHFNTNKAREGEDLTDLYRKEYAQPFPIMPTPPSGWGCDGTHCTNPQMDCINCPRKTTGGSFSTSSASGTSAATLHDNTSVTDGKPHNPSFTD